MAIAARSLARITDRLSTRRGRGSRRLVAGGEIAVVLAERLLVLARELLARAAVERLAVLRLEIDLPGGLALLGQLALLQLGFLGRLALRVLLLLLRFLGL